MKKWPGILAGLAGVILAALGIGMKLKEQKAAAAIAVIGGADGPTSIFLAGKISEDVVMGVIAAGVLLIAAAVGWVMHRMGK